MQAKRATANDRAEPLLDPPAMGLALDQELHALEPRERAHEELELAFGVVEATRPGRDRVWPGQPRRSVWFPFGGHAKA